ncbi:MAG: TIGR04141 family sporadically distributed protein [Pseudomonadota bacterium]|nr:TIGR04141 family sporadically distributed protein [Pseudomonadota bacterium]
MAEKTNRLSICLIKDSFTAFEDIVPDVAGHVIEGIGSFYGQDSFDRRPDWAADFFGGVLDERFNFRTASSKGVLLIEIKHRDESRVFALIFGHGRHLIADGAIEERFGLKVVLNSVERDNLRSIDKTALGAMPKQSREQMSREVDASSFGIDIEQDLLNSVTGRSRDARLGKTITGRDSLAVSVKIDLTEIAEFLPVLLDLYESDAYRASGFEWIDQIKDVRDSRKVSELDQWLTARIAAVELDRIWMAPPSIIDWADVAGFRYGGAKRPALKTDLEPAEFLATFDGTPSLTDIKGKRIHAISAKNDEPVESWNAYRCLYAEAQLPDGMYILNNGKWYEIAADFTAGVIADFANMPECDLVLPAFAGGREGAYNEAATDTLDGAFCLDAKLISHGGGHSSIEFCDIFTADNRLVHVKKYSGSAQLSHLFNQGLVSGELFVSAADFREKLNEKLPANRRLADTAARPIAGDHEIVFAIIMPHARPLDIPFFSKVSLRNARRRLEGGFGFKVTKLKIDSAVPNGGA